MLRIDRQPLDDALQQLAKQCDLQVIFFSRVTEGVAAPAIAGEYTLAAAMEKLLGGSQLTFRVINSQTVEVRPRQSKPVENWQPRERGADTAVVSPPIEEVVVVGLAEHLVATRIATPLYEIPQTVSIVTREQTRQQNNTDLSDVLRHVPGITATRVSSHDQRYYSRGYEITSLHVDGGAALDPAFSGLNAVSTVPADLSEFDHVEVLRGSDALFSGGGNPGGTLSLVRKRPQRAFSLETNVSAGSWDSRRIEVDITGPIALDGALRARADAVYSLNDFFYDSASSKRKKVFGALAWDITPDATLIAGGSYQSDDLVPFVNGLPRNEDGSNPRLPRDTSFVFDWQRQRMRTNETYLQYRQVFAGEWDLKMNVGRWRTTADVASGNFANWIDADTQSLGAPTFQFTESPVLTDQVTADATLTGVLDWFGRRAEIAVGGDITRVKSDVNAVYYESTTSLEDVRNFDPADWPDPRPAGSVDLAIDGDTHQDHYGVFASLRVYLDDAWSALAGVRSSGFSAGSRINADFGGLEFSQTMHTADSRILSPYAALMYAFGSHFTFYASYSDIYGDSGALYRPDGSIIDEKHGVTLEAGVKSQWRGGAINASLVAYRTSQTNSLLYGVSANPDMEYEGICCVAGETSRSHGIDLELSGELMPGLQGGAGYTYNENSRPGGVQYSAITPKHLFKAWASAELPGKLDRWAVGGTLHAQSKNEISRQSSDGSAPFRTHLGQQPSYALLDLRAGFEVDENWQLGLSINNVFDKTYYESIGATSFSNWYGEPRNLTLRIDGRF